MKRMNKSGVIKELAREACITQAAAAMALDRVRDIIVSEVKDNGRFELSGVGVFTLVERAARTGRNPQTGAAIDVPAKNTVKFKPAPNFKQAPNSAKK
jgi:DNA-binding protein HU-beta